MKCPKCGSSYYMHGKSTGYECYCCKLIAPTERDFDYMSKGAELGIKRVINLAIACDLLGISFQEFLKEAKEAYIIKSS